MKRKHADVRSLSSCLFCRSRHLWDLGIQRYLCYVRSQYFPYLSFEKREVDRRKAKYGLITYAFLWLYWDFCLTHSEMYLCQFVLLWHVTNADTCKIFLGRLNIRSRSSVEFGEVWAINSCP